MGSFTFYQIEREFKPPFCVFAEGAGEDAKFIGNSSQMYKYKKKEIKWMKKNK